MNIPTKDDQKKLARTIKYLMTNMHLLLILSMNEHGVLEWWMDASFAVHDDTRSRTGALFSLGKDVIYCASTKQKIVTSSSTEAELVEVVDGIPKILLCSILWSHKAVMLTTYMYIKITKASSY